MLARQALGTYRSTFLTTLDIVSLCYWLLQTNNRCELNLSACINNISVVSSKFQKQMCTLLTLCVICLL